MFFNNYHYFIKLYIDITTSMYLALCICVLFISFMQSVNGAQVLNITSLLLLFGFTAGGGIGAMVIVSLPSTHASL